MENMDYDLRSVQEARNLARLGQIATEQIATYNEDQIDRIIRNMVRVAEANAVSLAQMAVEETGFGKVEDKTYKNHMASTLLYDAIKDMKTCGIISEDPVARTMDVADPVGLLMGIVPSTNPTSTAIFKSIIAIKARNAIVFSPHPSAAKCTQKAAQLMYEAAVEAGAPANIIGCITMPSMQATNELMHSKEVKMIIATGGPGMVKAAYSSGKPAFGVGAGNVQTLVDRDADIADVAQKVVVSRIYDNGVLCTCEQCVHVPVEKYDELVAELVKLGAHYISEPADVDALRKGMFPTGSINKDVVGASPAFIAKTAGLECPEEAKLLLVKIEKYGADEYLAKEKLCPVLAIRAYDTWEEAVDVAVTNLKNEGAGHSAVVHSNTKEHVEYAAELLPVSRVGVNMIGSSGLGGGLDNGLNPTATLGCGTWGNNSISENLWWHNLVNIARIAYRLPDKPIPTDEEIWAE